VTKKRIAILGGGMAGLTCAYELSRPELRDLYEITIYQMGWRLGGKAAAGRDKYGRNLEHGLHVWFGYYENSFRLLQEVYAILDAPPDAPLRTWEDAFKPHIHTGIGVKSGEGWSHVPVDWPMRPGSPGDGTPTYSLRGALSVLAGLIENLMEKHAPHHSASPIAEWAFAHGLYATALGHGREAHDPHPGLHLAHGPALTAKSALGATRHWIDSMTGGLGERLHDQLHALGELVTAADHAFRARHRLETDTPTQRLIGETIHVFAVALRGAIVDLLIPDKPFEAIDNEDFRAWLLRHKGDPAIIANSSIVRVVYDISFQYTDGRLDSPDCAAGSALGSIIRMIATYKGSMCYLAQGGFGEAVISPLYEALRAAGVKFKFFHKIVGLELSEDKTLVQRVRINRQADTVGGREYSPTLEIHGVPAWPAQPLWEQLVDGAQMQADDVDFESRWCTREPVGEVTLRHGEDFDHVVLAAAMGAYKPLTDSENGDVDPGFCHELAEANPAFARFLTIPLSPTLALQIWSDKTLDELGWVGGKCATVSGPQPLNIWADMTQVLDVEPKGPKSLHYFCGAYPTTLYAARPSRASVPHQAEEEVKEISRRWLNESARVLFPAAVDGDQFDWSVLSDPENREGEARFEAQFWRANIEPTECCVASATGSTLNRLLPDESGFGNLTLTGEGTRHGLNATAVEAAVMSGMKAAYVVSGQAKDIPGFDFLMRKPWSGPWGVR
jgi:uncharacterized protein with NAD-binding domain and iron-sulfur cluster